MRVHGPKHRQILNEIVSYPERDTFLKQKKVFYMQTWKWNSFTLNLFPIREILHKLNKNLYRYRENDIIEKRVEGIINRELCKFTGKSISSL